MFLFAHFTAEAVPNAVCRTRPVYFPTAGLIPCNASPPQAAERETNRLRRLLLAALLILLATGPIAANRATAASLTPAERSRALANLKWVYGPASLPIGAPAARFELDDGMLAVTGADAQRAWELLQTGNAPDLQAVVLIKEPVTAVFVTYAEPGYVRMDDWASFNAEAYMAQLIEFNRQRTPIREAAGLAPMLDVHWEIEPQVNQTEAVFHWAISYFAPEKKLRGLNIMALRLGRRGYARLGVTISMDNYDKHPEVSRLLETNFHFEPGGAYADFAPGDKVAPFGIAALAMRPLSGE